jgi:hypothetical protein
MKYFYPSSFKTSSIFSESMGKFVYIFFKKDKDEGVGHDAGCLNFLCQLCPCFPTNRWCR